MILRGVFALSLYVHEQASVACSVDNGCSAIDPVRSLREYSVYAFHANATIDIAGERIHALNIVRSPPPARDLADPKWSPATHLELHNVPNGESPAATPK